MASKLEGITCKVEKRELYRKYGKSWIKVAEGDNASAPCLAWLKRTNGRVRLRDGEYLLCGPGIGDNPRGLDKLDMIRLS